MNNLLKVNLTSIIEGIEFQGDEAQSCLNKLSGEIITITDEEIQIAESKGDVTDYADWMKEAINNHPQSGWLLIEFIGYTQLYG